MRVVVVGAGVVGLTTAVRLAEAGAQVALIADADLPATTSFLAAGIWFPTHVGPAERVAGWGARTLEVLREQAQAGDVPGALIRESLMLYREPYSPDDPAQTASWIDAVGPVRPARPAELPPGYTTGLRFAVPLADPPAYLPWLLARARELGVTLTRRHLNRLDDLDHPHADATRPDVIVNCTGLAARDLVDDPSVHPVRGQIIRVTNPGLTMSVRDEHHPAGRAYVHPRTSDCVLGGTLDEGTWDTTPDPKVAESILARCLDLVPRLADAQIIEHRVGLRPGRSQVRLEVGRPTAEGIPVVHNYGHGGAGITLSWGCAQEATTLVLTGQG